MSSRPDFLPQLVLFEDSEGDWERYLEIIYEFFRQDFIESKPIFRGSRLALKRHPVYEGKEATFWHLISEGKAEEERLPDLRRCERIRWPRPIIENNEDSHVKVWENVRRGEKRICLWIENCEYLVVLAVRSNFILLWTAYLVTFPHQKRKLQKEFARYKAGAAS